MARIYYNLIKKNLKTIGDVPSVWKQAVEEMLASDKLVE